jgi:hypothetical protein
MSAPSLGRLQPYIDPDEILQAALPLLAGIPGLLEKLLEASRLDKRLNQPHSFFNDLFIGTSHPALGAHYHIVSYRLRNPDEWDFMGGATKENFADFYSHAAPPVCGANHLIGDVVPSEITDSMISAGEGVLLAGLGGAVEAFWSPRDLAISVYRAMQGARST